MKLFCCCWIGRRGTSWTAWGASEVPGVVCGGRTVPRPPSPQAAGSKKTWGTPTDDFWCCHGSLVQTHSHHDRYIYYANRADILIAQYIPSEAAWS